MSRSPREVKLERLVKSLIEAEERLENLKASNSVTFNAQDSVKFREWKLLSFLKGEYK